jgi:cell division protein FtsB
MKRINIFRPGRHTDAGGTTLHFTEDQLRAAVDAYDPSLHEAPIVVGHPKDNHPAYGWIGAMEYSEEAGIDAIPQQVDAEFAEMVTAGRFKKVSASWYMPDSPANPKPGSYYLRHVGFLGAQPPAIKGLKAVEFNEAEEGVVEFSGAWETETTAGIFRRLREFIIDKFSKDEADAIIPDYAINGLEDSARKQIDDEYNDAETDPAFSEGDDTTDPEDQDMDPKQLKADNERLQAENADLKTQVASFTEREEALQQREAQARRDQITAAVDAAIKQGKVLPAQRDNLIAFMENLDDGKTVEFAEGESKAAKPLPQALLAILNAAPARVDFSEQAGDDHRATDMTPEELADKATAYRNKRAAEGKSISFTEAVAAVESGNTE